MELKYKISITSIITMPYSNRTFMELKYVPLKAVPACSLLLQSHLYGIEIYFRKFFPYSPLDSNRTFMELKYILVIESKLPISNSNRTFMELKFDLLLPNSNCIFTPIAPLWNWNQMTMLLRVERYYILQSHLYGIEILHRLRISFRQLQLQSHLYGIEISSTNVAK